MAFEDKVLKCKDCGADFIFSVRDQEFYQEKGFVNEPARCRPCRMARKGQSGDARPPREMHDAICAACGAATQVPFLPRNDRPVYCQSCFDKMK